MSIKSNLKKIGFFKAINKIRWDIIHSRMVSKLKKNGYVSGLKGKKARFYFPFIETDQIQQCIFFGQTYYENEYLDYLCDEWHDGIIGQAVKGGTILDIGSNIGNHSLYFLLERGADFSYCFEPLKETFEILKKNMELNYLENRTKLFNAGVGAGSGRGCIAFSRDKNTAYTQVEMLDNGDLEIVSIDDLNIKREIDFIKLDVEGFELEVIKGMVNTLKKDKPMMMIEIWTRNLDEIHKIMDPMGYEFELMEDRGYQADYVCYPK